MCVLLRILCLAELHQFKWRGKIGRHKVQQSRTNNILFRLAFCAIYIVTNQVNFCRHRMFTSALDVHVCLL